MYIVVQHYAACCYICFKIADCTGDYVYGNLINTMNLSFVSVFSQFKKNNAVSVLVYFSLIVFLALYAVDRTTLPVSVNFKWFGSATRILRFFILGLGILSCWFYESKLKTALCVLFFAFSYIAHKYSGSWFLFDLFFIPLFLSKRININTVISIFFYVLAVAAIITVFLDIYNILPQLSFGKRGKFERYNLGFAHPNSLGLMLMLLGMSLILKVKRVTFDHILALVLLGIICMVVPNSNTSAFTLLALAVLLCLTMKFQNIKLNLTASVIIFAVLLLFFTAVIIAVYYVSLTGAFKEYIVRLPGAMWSRFSLGAEAYAKYGFSLFGQPYNPKYTNPGFFVVDCTCFYLPVFIGIIPSIVYLLLVYRAIWFSLRNSSFNLLLVQLLIFIYSVSEYIVIYPLFMFIYFNFGNESKKGQACSNCSD